MHKILFSVLLLISFSSIANDTTLKWQEIPEWKTPGIQAYVDVNNLTHEDSDNIKIVSGLVLFQYDVPVKISVNNKNVAITSVIRYYVVNCSSPMVLRVADYYFNTEDLPLATDEAIVTKAYKEKPLNIADTNPLYKSFCPKYI